MNNTVESSTIKATTVTMPARSVILATIIVCAVVLSVVLVGVLLLAGVSWWWAGLPLGFVLSAGLVFWRLRLAETSLLSSVGAVPVQQTAASIKRAESRLVNLVEALSLSAGIVEPDVYVAHDAAMNAAALARNGHGSLVVSSSLAENLTRVELEGVVAELVARIKSGDAEVGTVSSALFGPLLTGATAPFTSSLGVWLTQKLYISDRELVSDGNAVQLTRYPPGLQGALRKIRQGSAEVQGCLPVHDPLWLVPPIGGENRQETMYSGATDLDLRIDVLGEL